MNIFCLQGLFYDFAALLWGGMSDARGRRILECPKQLNNTI